MYTTNPTKFVIHLNRLYRTFNILQNICCKL